MLNIYDLSLMNLSTLKSILKTKQLNKLVNSYNIVRYRIENDNKYNIYFTLVYSMILYGIEVYGSEYKKHE